MSKTTHPSAHSRLLFNPRLLFNQTPQRPLTFAVHWLGGDDALHRLKQQDACDKPHSHDRGQRAQHLRGAQMMGG